MAPHAGSMNTPTRIASLLILASRAECADLPQQVEPLVVRVEVVQVTPEPQDREPAAPSRWERFAAALGPGRSARPRVTQMRFNDGSRTECRDGAWITACEQSGQFTLVGNRAWTGR
jgi:hypothetical protein